MNLFQIGVFLTQGTLVALLILFLFRIRHKMGIGLLFACLGLFQFMQVFLSSTIYVEISKGIIVSPGSSVLFTATLFAILLIYIKEDSTETRKIIYALLITNIIMSILLQTFSWNIEKSNLYNPFNVSTKLFNNNAWVLFDGTLVLFIDSILIIILYEFISKYVRFLFLQISLTIIIVASFDTLCFSLGAFWGSKNLNFILLSGLLSKVSFAIFYSIFVYLYLRYIEKDVSETANYKIRDVFQALSYRQKFEFATKDKVLAKEEALLKELKYQTLTSISPVGIFHTKSDGYTTYVNPKWCEISGLSEKEAFGDDWLNAVHPEDRQSLKKEWEKAVELKCKSETEYRFLKKDGSVRWVLGRAVPEVDNNNVVTGFVGTITDITDIIHYQREQTRLRLKAEESDKLKSAFLANMSHEIRTPMNGILGFAGLLKEPNLSGAKQKEYIKIIENSSSRMLNIINDIVDISKIEAGLMNLYLSKVNINDSIDFIYNFFIPQAEEKGLILSVKFNLPTIEATINTDSEKLFSILTNLVKNAIKYSKSGEITIGYSLKDSFVEFYVKDQGIGIPKDRHEAVFERFIQADISDKMALQGAGLGLSISKAFVEMLGGKIWLESEEGKGSMFCFTLPYNVDSVINETEQIDANLLNIKIPALKYLIVDDDDASRKLISIILKSFNSEIIEAKNGIEAIEFCKSNTDIDLVLMDIQMPIMNGHEATKQIRKFNNKVIIIAQTAFGFTGDKENVISSGCNDYISKPIVESNLLSIIKKHCGYY